ncbi:hypothetical protein O1L60_33785 [Streptomyces diastatochromogenes]|nr:hypothetical protein [Streptomyces diastatochromogenes]
MHGPLHVLTTPGRVLRRAALAASLLLFAGLAAGPAATPPKQPMPPHPRRAPGSPWTAPRPAGSSTASAPPAAEAATPAC